MPSARILSIHDPQAIDTACSILRNDGLVIFPTDTIYGVAANAFSRNGIKKIYLAKERPTDKALPILIGDLDQLGPLVGKVSDSVQKMAAAFWPGALTLILPKSGAVPTELSPYPTVGIRMPDHDVTRDLLRRSGPLATTSANLSGGPNPTSAEEAAAQLGQRVDLILDGGPTPGAAASTVVDASGPNLKMLREGPITLNALERLMNED